MIRSVSAASLALLIVCVPTSVRAQGHALPSTGSYGLSFSLPEGGGTGLGLRKMLSSRTSLGTTLIFGAGWQERSDSLAGDHSNSSVSVGVRPDLRLYRRSAGPVVPFVGLDAELTCQSASDDAWALGGGVGVGAEWLPLRGMSVSGWTGVATRYRHSDSGRASENAFNVGVFRSELTLNL